MYPMSDQFKNLKPNNEMSGFMIHQARISHTKAKPMLLTRESVSRQANGGFTMEQQESINRMIQNRPNEMVVENGSTMFNGLKFQQAPGYKLNQ